MKVLFWAYIASICTVVIFIKCTQKPYISPAELEQRYLDSTAQACREHGGSIYRDSEGKRRWCQQ